MKEIGEMQYRILGALLYVEPFSTLLEEVRGRKAEIADDLRTLIDRGWVKVMTWDSHRSDYVPSIVYDTDNMHAFAYTLTREGLKQYEACRQSGKYAG